MGNRPVLTKSSPLTGERTCHWHFCAVGEGSMISSLLGFLHSSMYLFERPFLHVVHHGCMLSALSQWDSVWALSPLQHRLGFLITLLR